MAKPKKQKAKAPASDQPLNAHAEQSNVEPGVRVKSPSHDVTANSPAAFEGDGYAEWGAPGYAAGHDADDGWGDGEGGSAGDTWGDPGPQSAAAAADDWGAPSGGNWDGPPAAVDNGWGAPASPASMGGGGYETKKSSLKKGGAHSHSQQSAPPPPPHAQAPAHTSFHPSAAAHMSSAHHASSFHHGAHPPAQDWGAPAPSGWDNRSAWGQPAPAPPPKAPPAPSGAKPAWTNWVNEAKGMPMVNTQPTSYQYPAQSAAAADGGRRALSQQQRSQILNSLLETDNQYTKDYFSQSQAQAAHQSQRNPSGSHHARPQQALHPSQQWQDPQFLAEQQSILHSIQEARSQGRSHHSQQGRAQPIQHVDSWGYMGGGGWGERASTIPEEDEYEDEDDDGWGVGGGDDKGYGWGNGHASNGRVRFSPDVSYASSPRRSHSNAAPLHPSAGAHQPSAHRNPQQYWTPSATASKTMKFATGAVSTTVFELAPPRSGLGEMGFVDSRGAALKPAERALYNRDRPAKERFRWGFNPDKDPRVGSLLRWIATMSNGLATIGLQRFLETQERGALFANADFRVPSQTPGLPDQPAFDYITLDRIQKTLDATLQESVKLYDPAFQVVVFVFLLSPSGNSMALWRRKLNVPDDVREAHHDDILAVKAELKDYPVYVDEGRLPVKPEAAAPKKKVRFAFLRRLFGGKKSAAAS